MAYFCQNEDCQEIAKSCEYHKKAVKEAKEALKQQKKQLDDYRKMNMKLFDDTVELEKDIKEKEDFENKMKRKRNDLAREIKFLLEKVEIKNEDIVKLSVVNEKLKENSAARIKTIEDENNDLKKELATLQRKIDLLETQSENEQEMIKEIRKLKKEVGDIDIANHQKEEQIKNLTVENKELNAKIITLEADIIDMKKETCIEENNSVSSLAEELNLCKIIHTDVTKFQCSSCDETFITRNDLKLHLNAHVTQIEENIKSQESRKPCTCKRFCRINHAKHNWKNSKSSDILTKFETIKVDDGQTDKTKDALQNQLKCSKSDKLFINRQNNERHKESEHSSEEEDDREVEENGQKGGMS